MEYIRIFLADDDADDRFFFERAISKAALHANITTAEDGQQLIDLLAEIEQPPPPDIIFLDINMPCKNGKDCLIEIRNNDKFNMVPVIMFSTSTHHRDIDETFETGASRYIHKTEFFDNQLNMLEKLFCEDWKTLLLTPVKEQFVLKAG